MSLFTVLGLWVALSFLASPLIGAFIYRQTRLDRGYAGRKRAAGSLESFGRAAGVGGTAQISVGRPEVAVRQPRRVGRSLSIPAQAIRPLLQ